MCLYTRFYLAQKCSVSECIMRSKRAHQWPRWLRALRRYRLAISSLCGPGFDPRLLLLSSKEGQLKGHRKDRKSDFRKM